MELIFIPSSGRTALASDCAADMCTVRKLNFNRTCTEAYQRDFILWERK